ncbi:flavin monoamine oxidase family protein [Roseobacter sp. S98]|uniref:flavin monoamine oxidase family protein n=1 Tax=Roseobacter algicola (ex Choi et al. 2025) (nom. illeg.) TaxID=3092138 RepID=UPI0035C6ADBD
MKTDTLIIGAGLAGLHLAHTQEQRGRDVLLCEAADGVGGRVRTQQIGGIPVDLGPAWIWPDQPRIAALADALGLTVFDQFSTGAGLWQTGNGDVHRSPGAGSMRGSWRIAGGLGGITRRLADRLSSARLLLNTPVQRLIQTDDGITATTPDGAIEAQHVVLALPPRIAHGGISFEPELPQAVAAEMQNVPTWMAGHAKFVAVYDRPWWREAGLSGDAISQRGPLAEIHDASPHDESGFALFGFVGTPPATRATHRDAVICEAVNQLVTLFGPELAQPKAVHMEDWATDPLIATMADHDGPTHHPAYGTPDALRDLWGGRLIFASSEMGDEYGGFLEGALVAAEQAAARLG